MPASALIKKVGDRLAVIRHKCAAGRTSAAAAHMVVGRIDRAAARAPRWYRCTKCRPRNTGRRCRLSFQT